MRSREGRKKSFPYENSLGSYYYDDYMATVPPQPRIENGQTRQLRNRNDRCESNWNRTRERQKGTRTPYQGSNNPAPPTTTRYVRCRTERGTPKTTDSFTGGYLLTFDIHTTTCSLSPSEHGRNETGEHSTGSQGSNAFLPSSGPTPPLTVVVMVLGRM